MENPKVINSRDRLSELSNDLIYIIFWYLPIIDVVRTTFLSKRWVDVWKTAPFLNLDAGDFYEDVWKTLPFPNIDRSNFARDMRKARDFIDRALRLWGGIKILKLRIHCQEFFAYFYGFDVGAWVDIAKNKAVEELEFDLEGGFLEANWATERVYSCSSLKVLSITRCKLKVIENVRWDRLESLTITLDCRVDARAIGHIMLGCPILQVLVLNFYGGGEDLFIQSSSLKTLLIQNNGVARNGISKERLKINTPNVETLEIEGGKYGECSLIGASSLTRVTLGFRKSYDHDDDGTEWIEGAFTPILPTIRYVENLTLSYDCIQVLRRSESAPFPKVKFLEFEADFSKHKEIAALLELFPKLEWLVVYQRRNYEDEEEEDQFKFETNLPNSFLLQLTRADVTWDEGDYSIFPFIEILLKYATNLQKMVFRVQEIYMDSTQSENLFLASKKLLKMPRSSPTSQLIFC